MGELVMDRLRENLENLKMKNTLSILDNYLERAVSEKLNVVDVLDYIFDEEAKSKRKRAYEKQVQMSGFPIKKTLEDFDFSFQPSIDKRQIEELATMRFLESRENIVFLGPPGVGKTSICACIVRLLVEKYPDRKILAIDADPAVGLSVALGVDVKLTLDDIRMSIVDSVENGETREALEILSEARFRIFDALVEMPGFAFLAIGRPESSGCYCKVNSYLKEVIGILSNSFDFVVIDGEAGIEQIQRRVMDQVTHLLLITDQSKKGGQVITTIKNVADKPCFVIFISIKFIIAIFTQ